MIPATNDRVHRNTHATLKDALQRRIRSSLERHAQGTPECLERRLTQLDHEWDTDRVVETVYSSLILAGLTLGSFSPRLRWLAGVGATSLLSHALFGWDPLLPLYRHAFRTSAEIDQERDALKAVRGDFQKLTGFVTPEDRDAISRLEGEGGPAYDGPSSVDAADEVVVEEVLLAIQK
jgi:hypothetical protein